VAVFQNITDYYLINSLLVFRSGSQLVFSLHVFNMPYTLLLLTYFATSDYSLEVTSPPPPAPRKGLVLTIRKSEETNTLRSSSGQDRVRDRFPFIGSHSSFMLLNFI
jgi:hypothetical protein